MSNHVQNPKTEAIKCIGYKDAEGVQQFAKDHQEFRLVHKQDKSQTKRCVECQKMHAKVNTAKTSEKTRARSRDRRLVEDMKTARTTQKKVGDKLSTADQKELQKAISAGEAAEKRLAKLAVAS